MMTHTELAILSLIVEKARHGYEIEQVIVERGMREWTDIGFSSIYYILRKLEKEQLVTARLDDSEGRGPARKVYEVTAAGRHAWHEATLAVLSRPQRQPSPLQLGLANLFALPNEEALTALRAYREAQQAQREQVLARREGQRPLHPYVAAMFDHALALLAAELGWLDNFIQQMEAMHDEP
jgi:DNA-binding PadR family transcriptional regulator